MRIVGVDPGAYGALAYLVDGRLVDIEDMPSFKVRRGKTDKAEVNGYVLADILRRWAPDVVWIEQVGGLPGQSASAAFNFGRAAGAVEYAAKALGYKVEFVPPNTWKRALRVKDGKDDSRAKATAMFSNAAHLFARKKDNDRAEAALIAEYGRINGGNNELFG